jgi:hypothetical protein
VAKIRCTTAGLPEVIIGNDPSGTGMLRVGGGADINGTVRAKEVVVTLNGWSDYVFSSDYRLAPLSEVAEHIESKRHLPGIPSEAEIVSKGLSMGEMQRLHMAKIEELTLYAIAADRRLTEAGSRQSAYDGRLQELTKELERSRNENVLLRARMEAIERALSLGFPKTP